MKTAGFYVKSLLLCLVVSCASCERKPGRPDIFLYTWLEQAGVWEGENSTGVIKQAKPEELFCTDLAGYLDSEKYIDSKELRVRELERQLSQCQKKNP